MGTDKCKSKDKCVENAKSKKQHDMLPFCADCPLRSGGGKRIQYNPWGMYGK